MLGRIVYSQFMEKSIPHIIVPEMINGINCSSLIYGMRSCTNGIPSVMLRSKYATKNTHTTIVSSMIGVKKVLIISAFLMRVL